jgi:DNA-binding LacI/PurR family transcriptional regulator
VRGRATNSVASVVGFDDIPEAAYFLPPLTTIRQDFDKIGSRSLRLLLATIEAGERLSPGARVQPELVVRESAGVPPR